VSELFALPKGGPPVHTHIPILDGPRRVLNASTEGTIHYKADPADDGSVAEGVLGPGESASFFPGSGSIRRPVCNRS
jgi:hypothetical protein